MGIYAGIFLDWRESEMQTGHKGHKERKEIEMLPNLLCILCG
jgi:hypothetical protein